MVGITGEGDTGSLEMLLALSDREGVVRLGTGGGTDLLITLSVLALSSPMDEQGCSMTSDLTFSLKLSCCLSFSLFFTTGLTIFCVALGASTPICPIVTSILPFSSS